MHVLFLAPDTHVYNNAFVRGLKAVGARVSGIGPAPQDKLGQGVQQIVFGQGAGIHGPSLVGAVMGGYWQPRAAGLTLSFTSVV